MERRLSLPTLASTGPTAYSRLRLQSLERLPSRPRVDRKPAGKGQSCIICTQEVKSTAKICRGTHFQQRKRARVRFASHRFDVSIVLMWLVIMNDYSGKPIDKSNKGMNSEITKNATERSQQQDQNWVDHLHAPDKR